jgi:peroxiredoxin
VKSQSFTIEGTIEGKDTGIALLRYLNRNYQITVDTAVIRNGKFRFEGSVLGADYAMLITDTTFTSTGNTYNRQFFVEPGKMTISFFDGALDNAIITGSVAQKEEDGLRFSQAGEMAVLKRTLVEIDSIRTLLRSGAIQATVAQSKIKEINQTRSPAWKGKLAKDLAFVNSHPRSYVSLSLLKYAVSYIPNDSIDHVYTTLSDSVRNSSLGFGFADYYATYKKRVGEAYPFDNLMLGEPAPPFSIYATGKDTATLQSFKRKAILLNFWELTCLPCLQKNLMLKKLLANYRKDAVEVVAINSATEKELPGVASYIKRNSLSDWQHVTTNKSVRTFGLSFYRGEFDQYYKIGVPRTILIDANGTIAYKQYGFSADDMKELAILLDKIAKE